MRVPFTTLCGPVLAACSQAFGKACLHVGDRSNFAHATSSYQGGGLAGQMDQVGSLRVEESNGYYGSMRGRENENESKACGMRDRWLWNPPLFCWYAYMPSQTVFRMVTRHATLQAARFSRKRCGQVLPFGILLAAVRLCDKPVGACCIAVRSNAGYLQSYSPEEPNATWTCCLCLGNPVCASCWCLLCNNRVIAVESLQSSTVKMCQKTFWKLAVPIIQLAIWVASSGKFFVGVMVNLLRSILLLHATTVVMFALSLWNTPCSAERFLGTAMKRSGGHPPVVWITAVANGKEISADKVETTSRFVVVALLYMVKSPFWFRGHFGRRWFGATNLCVGVSDLSNIQAQEKRILTTEEFDWQADGEEGGGRRRRWLRYAAGIEGPARRPVYLENHVCASCRCVLHDRRVIAVVCFNAQAYPLEIGGEGFYAFRTVADQRAKGDFQLPSSNRHVLLADMYCSSSFDKITSTADMLFGVKGCNAVFPRMVGGSVQPCCCTYPDESWLGERVSAGQASHGGRLSTRRGKKSQATNIEERAVRKWMLGRAGACRKTLFVLSAGATLDAARFRRDRRGGWEHRMHQLDQAGTQRGQVGGMLHPGIVYTCVDLSSRRKIGGRDYDAAEYDAGLWLMKWHMLAARLERLRLGKIYGTWEGGKESTKRASAIAFKRQQAGREIEVKVKSKVQDAYLSWDVILCLFDDRIDQDCGMMFENVRVTFKAMMLCKVLLGQVAVWRSQQTRMWHSRGFCHRSLVDRYDAVKVMLASGAVD
eukprot:jgi/Mesvir1/18060/Mv09372-RA.1